MKRAIFFIISLLLLCSVLRKAISGDSYISLSSLLTYLETAPTVNVSSSQFISWGTINWPQWLNFIVPLFKLIEPSLNFVYFLGVVLYNFLVYVYYFFSFIFAI